MRTVHNLVQGSAEWLAFRASVDGSASEASAMLGISSYKSRDDLIREKATGIRPEVDARTQERFDDGHRVEALARPVAEIIIGEDLYPATYSIEIDGLVLSASCDGLTIDDEVAFEHKKLNVALRESLSQNIIPDEYHPQCEQVSMCTGASKVLFMASNGTEESALYVWYTPNPELRARIIAGWKQLKIDVANYVNVEAAPTAVAEEVEMLPSIDIRANGQITVIDNLDVLEKRLSVFLSDKLIRKPQTDNDFATLDLQIKAMIDAEDKLKMAGVSILAQIQAVDDAMRRKDSLHELVRQNRIMAEKLLANEKDRRKREIIDEARQAFADHITTCNQALANTGTSVRMPEVPVDFVGAAKNKRTIDSLRGACNDELARGKIEANRILSKMDDNLALLRKIAVNHKSLFADIQQLVLKDKDALEAIAKQRISEHEAAEKARIEAEAQRIADEKIAAEKAAAEAVAAEATKTVKPEAKAPKAEFMDIPEFEEVAPITAGDIGRGAQNATTMPNPGMQNALARRPPDYRIVEVLAGYFEVEQPLVIEWLRQINLDAVEKKLVAA